MVQKGGRSLDWLERRQLLEELFIHRRDAMAVHTGENWRGRIAKNGWDEAKKKIIKYEPYDPAHGYNGGLYHHTLTGDERVGIYPHGRDDKTKLAVMDFDDKDRTNSQLLATGMKLKQTFATNNIHAHVERSHSGGGYHLWIFFEEPVPCELAIKVMTEGFAQAGLPMVRGENGFDKHLPGKPLLQHFDRDGILHPGGLIGLPLQKKAVDKGNCVFIDDEGNVIPDQWKYLKHMKRVSQATAEKFTTATKIKEFKPQTGRSDSSSYWEIIAHLNGQFERIRECEAIKAHIANPNQFPNEAWSLGIVANAAVFAMNDDIGWDKVLAFLHEIEIGYESKSGSSEDGTEKALR